MKNKKLIIVGLGETAILAYEYFTYDSKYEVVAFSADKEYLIKTNPYTLPNNLPIVDIENLTQEYPIDKYEIFVAMGSGELNRQRTKMFDKIKNMGYTCASYISSKAFVWHNANIGENCFILENNTLQPFTNIEDNVTLWSGNHIGHRSIVKKNCFISSHVAISGFCEIGEYTFMGVNSSVADNIKIAKNNFIGMNCTISRNTEEDNLFVVKNTELSKFSAKMFCGVKE